MIELGHLVEREKLKPLPQGVQETIEGILQVLDTEYGTYRDVYQDDGGYVIVIERKEDLEEIKGKACIDCDTATPEYVDKIVCSSGEVYTNSLILCNNEFAISLIIPVELTPQNLIDYIVE